jgi:hypothetical protein
MFSNNKHRYGLSAVLAVFWLSSAVANAAGPPAAVYPTGLFPLDVENVQAAINLGGVVLLKATDSAGHALAFNFGPANPRKGTGVNLSRDVVIRGERSGTRLTTIKGGYIPILGQLPVKSRIEGIDFDGPLAYAVALFVSRGAEIVGNHIHGVVGVPVFFGTDADGIHVSGFDDPQHAVTGHVLIADNQIEMGAADFSNGMQLDSVAARVDILNNTVRYPRSNGRVQTVGITVFRSGARVSIAGNNISMGPGSQDTFPAPIFIAGQLSARYVVTLNNVIDNHPNGDGIVVSGGGNAEPTQQAVVAGNRIELHTSLAQRVGHDYEGLAGVDVFGPVNKSVIAGNVIRGTSAFALDVAGAGDLAEADRLIGNDLSEHKSVTTDVYFDRYTNNMLFVGDCKTDIDQGVNNQVVCDGASEHSVEAAARPADFRSHMSDVSRMDVRGAMRSAIRDRMAK